MFKFFKTFKRLLFFLFLIATGFVGVNFSAFWKLTEFHLLQKYTQFRKIEQMVQIIDKIQKISTDQEEKKKNLEPKLTIEKIGVEAPIIQIDAGDEQSIKQALKRGVVLLPTSALPEEGSPVILGNSSDYVWHKGDYKAVFALLGELNQKDKIKIQGKGREFIYQVENKKVVSEQAKDIVHQKEEKGIILITSWPLGTNFKRLVVKAKLIE